MTLEDAIVYYSEMAKECRRKARIESNDYMDMKDRAYEAEQLADWLNELKVLRERIDDHISRAAAIDAVVGCTNCGTEDVLRAYVVKHSLENGWTGGIVDALDAIEQLPSAQPEIIRCRECKHRDEYGCCKQWKGLLMSAIPIATDDDDFCSYVKR